MRHTEVQMTLISRKLRRKMPALYKAVMDMSFPKLCRRSLVGIPWALLLSQRLHRLLRQVLLRLENRSHIPSLKVMGLWLQRRPRLGPERVGTPTRAAVAVRTLPRSLQE